MGCVTSFLLFSVHLVCFLPRIFYAGLMPSPVLTRGWYEYILDVAFFLSTQCRGCRSSEPEINPNNLRQEWRDRDRLCVMLRDPGECDATPSIHS